MNQQHKQLLKSSLEKLSHVKKASGEGYVDSLVALDTIDKDQYLREEDKNKLYGVINEARRTPQGKLKGLLTTTDVAKGAVGAGFGWGAASTAAPILGSIFSLPNGLQKKISNTGALAGALYGSGIIS